MIGNSAALTMLIIVLPMVIPAMAQPTSTTHALLTPSLGMSGSGIQPTHGGWRTSQLVGASVYDDTNQNVGTIDNLIVDPDGRIRDVVLSVGGFLGVGRKLVEIPFDHLAFAKVNAGPDTTAISSTTTPVQPNLADNADSEVFRNGTEPPAAQATYVMVPGISKATLAAMPAFTYRG